MQKYTPEEYNAILDKLPDIIRDKVLSMDTTNLIWKIGETHRLQVDKIGTMHDMVMDTMMGIISSKDLPTELSKELNLPSAEIIPLMTEIDEKVFKPVREIMMKSFREGSPNKIRTISRIEENDDEHLHLTKHDVLMEIENPVESKFQRTVEIEKNPVQISKTTELEEYNEELTGNKIEMRKVDSLQRIENKIEESQKKEIPTVIPVPKSISETKLSGVTNIEKGTEIVTEKKEETPKSVIDPYREPMN